jgi:hypothetical protein
MDFVKSDIGCFRTADCDMTRLLKLGSLCRQSSERNAALTRLFWSRREYQNNREEDDDFIPFVDARIINHVFLKQRRERNSRLRHESAGAMSV